MGRGLWNRKTTMRVTNPQSILELMDADGRNRLYRDCYDIKALVRLICLRNLFGNHPMQPRNVIDRASHSQVLPKTDFAS